MLLPAQPSAARAAAGRAGGRRAGCRRSPPRRPKSPSDSSPAGRGLREMVHIMLREPRPGTGGAKKVDFLRPGATVTLIGLTPEASRGAGRGGTDGTEYGRLHGERTNGRLPRKAGQKLVECRQWASPPPSPSHQAVLSPLAPLPAAPQVSPSMAVLRWTNGGAQGLKMLAPADMEVVSLQVSQRWRERCARWQARRRLWSVVPGDAGRAAARSSAVGQLQLPAAPALKLPAGASCQAAPGWHPWVRPLDGDEGGQRRGAMPLPLGASSPSRAATTVPAPRASPVLSFLPRKPLSPAHAPTLPLPLHATCREVDAAAARAAVLEALPPGGPSPDSPVLVYWKDSVSVSFYPFLSSFFSHFLRPTAPQRLWGLRVGKPLCFQASRVLCGPWQGGQAACQRACAAVPPRAPAPASLVAQPASEAVPSPAPRRARAHTRGRAGRRLWKPCSAAMMR